MYSLTVATPSLAVKSKESGRMPQIHAMISELMPDAVQSEQTMLNAISASGFYVRGGLDSNRVASIVIVAPMTK
jgi:hypothetical protein